MRRVGVIQQCVHHWNIDANNVGVCWKCQELRQFVPQENKRILLFPRQEKVIEPEVSKMAGFPQPQCTVEEREAIVKDAVSRGIPAVAAEMDIPYATLYTWVKKRGLKGKEVPTGGLAHKLSKKIPKAEGKVRSYSAIKERLEAFRAAKDVVRNPEHDRALPGYIAALEWVLCYVIPAKAGIQKGE